MRYVCLAVGAVTILSAGQLAAFQLNVFRAEVKCDTCKTLSDMTIDVQDSQRRVVETATVNATGDAEFRSMDEGNYYLTVKNSRGDVVHSEFLAINRHTDRARIALPNGTTSERPVSGTVSLARLQHKIPKTARKQYDQAAKRMNAKDAAGARDHLLKAVEIDPQYMEAHNNLGTAYMKLDDYKSALAAFSKAAELEPSSGQVQVNIAIALMTLRDFSEAERAARRAIDLDSSDMKARFVLGTALYSQHQFTAETIDTLRRASDAFPAARIARAATHAQRRELDVARQILRDYLSEGLEAKRAEAQALLAQLK